MPERSSGLALVPLALLVHNVEEALTVAAHLPRLEAAAGALLGRRLTLPSAGQYHLALVLVTAAGLAAYGAARLWPGATYGLVVLQAVMSLNVLVHVGGSLLLGGYAPGIVTALSVEAPTSWVVYRRTRQARWMSRRQWRWLWPLALLVHGPLLLGLLLGRA